MENKVAQTKMPGTVLEGVVVSDKMMNTAVVSVDRFVKHAKYQKYFKISKKYKAENPENMYKVGDRVKMQSCRPLSKDKHFVIVEKTGKGYVESKIIGDESEVLEAKKLEAEFMLQPRSIVKVADNTGAKVGRVFKVLGGSKRHYSQIGDILVMSIQVAEPRKGVKKKDVVKAVVVRQKKAFRRKDGSYIRFDENAVVIIDAKKEPVGGRIFGPIPREIAELGYQKIASLAPEIV